MLCVKATKKFTLNNNQFFGIITMEYLDQMEPLTTKERLCLGLKVLGCRRRSAIPTRTMPHLTAGAQKKIVFGPKNEIIVFYIVFGYTYILYFRFIHILKNVDWLIFKILHIHRTSKLKLDVRGPNNLSCGI